MVNGYAREARRENRDIEGLRPQLKRYLKARRTYAKTVWDHPTAEWVDVFKDQYVKNLIANEDKYHAIAKLTRQLRKPKKDGGYGWAEDKIQRLRTDPTKLAQLHQAGGRRLPAANPLAHQKSSTSGRPPQQIMKSAIDGANKLHAQGFEVAYIPHVSSLDIRDTDPGRYGTGVASKAIARDLSSTKKRNMGAEFMPERYDLMASVHQATKEAIQRNVTIQFAEENLSPHAMTSGEVADWAQRAFRDEYADRNPADRNQADLMADHVMIRLGLVKWDPELKFGFSLPKWDNKAVYLPAGLPMPWTRC